MKIKEVTEYLNSRFLPVYQESYDNAGLLLGDVETEIKGVLATTDITMDVIDEAMAMNANLIVSHHPLIFNGIKRITPANETGRMVMRLLQEGIAVYAAHTNLDNLEWGVNGILAEKIGLKDCEVLRPLSGVLMKLVTYVPADHADRVRKELFAAGAGAIGGYDCCSYNSEGFGTFRAGDGCNPFCGNIGELHNEPEIRIEVIYEQRIGRRLIERLRTVHPYEEPAFDCIPLANSYNKVGAGMVGHLEEPLTAEEFLAKVKEKLNLPVIRTSKLKLKNTESKIQKVAVCGGSGSFLISDAKACGADIFMTGDLKYHDFQSAENVIILADIGHFESEQFAKELIHRVISEKFSNFACQIAKSDKGFIYYI